MVCVFGVLSGEGLRARELPEARVPPKKANVQEDSRQFKECPPKSRVLAGADLVSEKLSRWQAGRAYVLRRERLGRWESRPYRLQLVNYVVVGARSVELEPMLNWSLWRWNSEPYRPMRRSGVVVVPDREDPSCLDRNRSRCRRTGPTG